MSDSTKKVLLTIAAVIVGLWAAKWILGFALALLFQVVIPTLVVLGVVYVAYTFFSKKALGGGRKTLP